MGEKSIGGLSRFGAWFFGSSEPGQEDRRRWKRFGAHARVTLEWSESKSAVRQASGHLLDSCEGGFAVRSAEQLDIGQPVRLETADGVTPTIVRYCRPDDGEYVMGLETGADAALPNVEAASANHSKRIKRKRKGARPRKSTTVGAP